MNEKKVYFVYHLVGELIGFTEATSKTQAANRVAAGHIIPVDPTKFHGVGLPRINHSKSYEDMEFLAGFQPNQAQHLLEVFIQTVGPEKVAKEGLEAWHSLLDQVRTEMNTRLQILRKEGRI